MLYALPVLSLSKDALCSVLLPPFFDLDLFIGSYYKGLAEQSSKKKALEHGKKMLVSQGCAALRAATDTLYGPSTCYLDLAA